MIKLFKKIRRKIWDWRIDRLECLYVEHWKMADLLFGVVVDVYEPVLKGKNISKSTMRKYKILMKRVGHHQYLCEKYFEKHYHLKAKIDGQK